MSESGDCPVAPLGNGQSAAKATRREWIGLAVIALPCLVYAMDLTVLNLAIPAIAKELRPSSSQLLWIIDVYGFLVAGFLITMGTLGDRIGRRKLLLMGGAAFGVASVIAAFSRDAQTLIGMRALLGIAGATLAPSTMSLIRNMFHDAHERQFAIGVWIASFSIGGVIGPLVGGVMLQFFWWGSVFLVAVPVMFLLLVLGPRLLPEYRDPNAGSIDLLSVALSLGAVLGVVYGLKQIASHGIEWRATVAIVAGTVLGVAFTLRQGRLAYPLLDLSLFRQPAFSAAIAAYALSCLAMFGLYIFVTQYLQLVLDLSPLEAGLATLPWALTFALGSLLTPRLTRRGSKTTVLASGLAAAALGFAMLAWLNVEGSLLTLIAGTVVMSLGLAPVFTIGNEMIITAAPPERAGAASAISETSAELSGALGIALFGSVGMAIYRHALVGTLPAATPSDTASAALATLGGAVAAAMASTDPLADLLLSAARSAFVEALRAAALLGSATIALAALWSVRVLRQIR